MIALLFKSCACRKKNKMIIGNLKFSFASFSFPKINYDEDDPWLPLLYQGLRDILFSKLAKKHRDPALKLVSAVIEASDFEWCLQDPSGQGGGGEGERGKFFLIILNLSCIEVRLKSARSKRSFNFIELVLLYQVVMHLEERKLETILQDADLLVGCYHIIESAVQCMASDRLENSLEQKQKGQLYTALKNAFATILKFLSETSLTLKEEPNRLDDIKVGFYLEIFESD